MFCEAAAKPKPDVEGRSEKSAAGRSSRGEPNGLKEHDEGPSREAVLSDMSTSQAVPQMPTQTGRAGAAHGEAMREAASDEAGGPRDEPNDTGNPHAALRHAAFTRENLQRALKRVRANKGAAGVDGWTPTRPQNTWSPRGL